ncbi:MAG: bifunctional metallophosphatase/5'-nucleotidase [Bacteroidetes bacterium]|nr:bifunctional metallophosphatase/5'-nucleotidase [Bacteroidota bacterium]
MISRILLSIFYLSLFYSTIAQNRDTLCFIQLNDIYEINALQGGKSGGIARIATFIQSCKKRYPTYSFVAGDFLSPSVMGTAVVSGERLSGKQMIDGLNALGIDYVTFGNHEFDVGEIALQKRINESKFVWFSSNVKRSDGSPFYKDSAGFKKYFPASINITSPQKEFSVSLFSLTLPSNTPSYSRFYQYDTILQVMLPALRNKNTMIMGLTHLSAAEDIHLLEKYPAIRLSMGGHEHENMYLTSSHKSFVAKADANGKSIYKHLIYKNEKNNLEVTSELIKVDESIEADPKVISIVHNWEEKVYDAFRKQGLEPTRSVCFLIDTLNGLESSIRYEQNSMGNAVNRALTLQAGADVSFINAGAIRIDDKVIGNITELDVIRIMPFGNKIVEVEMKGELLEKMIKTNDDRKGLGGYLQYSSNIKYQNESVFLNDSRIENEKIYRIHTIEFLLSGKELKLEYFTPSNPLISRVTPLANDAKEQVDLRKAFIQHLKSKYNQ